MARDYERALETIRKLCMKFHIKEIHHDATKADFLKVRRIDGSLEGFDFQDDRFVAIRCSPSRRRK